MAKVQTNQEQWKLVGGRLCLDFVNTVGGRDRSNVLRDKLHDYHELLDWSRAAGIAKPAEFRHLAQQAASHRPAAEATLSRAVLLRETLYRVFKSYVDGRRTSPADLDTLSRELQVARAQQLLTRARGVFKWTWEDGDYALDRILWPISLSAAELLTSDHLSRLRQCGGQDCGWMFLDISRNRSRQWCDMKDCGNRAKVRRFRKRQRQTGKRFSPAR
jgi:predicted RNA-binding Zn ribbon-like protein